MLKSTLNLHSKVAIILKEYNLIKKEGKNMLNSALGRFRVISAIEGLSFLVLVLIAMPIKYIGGDPQPVKIIGMAHGVLFIIFMLSLFEAKIRHEWENSLTLQLFILSLIPFGAIFIEKKVKPIRNIN
ncbi:DUF3817 domain-containing protein [Halarcobacter mediterraneus]|nr:DUF3817 domain-containing protein [Halarcobacter mediterraneus]